MRCAFFPPVCLCPWDGAATPALFNMVRMQREVPGHEGVNIVLEKRTQEEAKERKEIGDPPNMKRTGQTGLLGEGLSKY